MAMYLLEITFLLELAVFAGGLVLLHQGRQGQAAPLRVAGFALVVGAIATALCTGYYSVRYHVQGEFDHAWAHPPFELPAPVPELGGPGMMHRGMMYPATPPAMMHRGMMHRGMMQPGPGTPGPGMMGPGMMAPGEGAPGAAPEAGPAPGAAEPGHHGEAPH